MTRSFKLAFACVLILSGGCADIDTYGSSECGNNVLEPDAGEDCDLLVDDSLGEDLLCGPADGSAQQCRYVCDGAECPNGWACEDDGICRPPSGLFEDDEDPVAVISAQQIALSNIQGDDEAELIVRLEGDVFVLAPDDAGYREEIALSIPNPRGELAFADVDEDDYVDLVLPAASRALDAAADPLVHVLRSDGERLATAVVPQRFAEDRIVALAPVTFAAGGADVLLRVIDGAEGELVLVAPNPDCAQPISGSSTGLVVSTGVVLPPPVSEDLVLGGIEHVVIPIPGDDRMSLVRVDRSCGPDVCVPAAEVEELCVTVLETVQRIRMPGAVSEFGCLVVGTDLVCHLAGDEFGVATYTGTAFEPQMADFDALSDLPAQQPRGCAPVNRILLARDLDEDGLDDLVTPHGVFVGDADAGFRRVFARTVGDAWGEAVAGDFDRDGDLEIVASVLRVDQGCAASRLESLEKTGEAYSNVLVRDASLPTRLLSADFDGDGIDDVAAVEQASESVRVSVFFGDTKEALEDKITVGGFESISNLAALRGRESAEINEDLIGDLAIVSEQGEFLTYVSGTTQRSLLSPLSFDAGGEMTGRSLEVALVGAIAPGPAGSDDDPRLPDLLTIAGEQSWLVRDEDLHHGDEPLAIPLGDLVLRAECSTWALGSANETGSNLFAGVDGHIPRVFDVDDDCGSETESNIVVARMTGSREAPVLRASAIAPLGDAGAPVQVLVFDFDATEADDVIVLFSREGNERRGGLQWLRDPAPENSSGSMSPQRLLEELDVLGAAPINADADDGLELAVLSADGLRIVDYAPDQDEPVSVSEPAFGVPRLPVANELVSLVAGDVDADEITDLALMIADSIYIYPALPRQ